MKTMKYSMKRNATVGLLVIIFLNPGCSEDEEISPSNDDEVATTSKIIGSGGGEIKFENLTISIPAGAFNGDHKLELSVSDKQNPFKEQKVSSLYSVKGIPEDFSESINIAIKYDGVLEDESYIAHSNGQALEGLDTNNIIFNLIQCKDSSGYLVGKLLPTNHADVTKAEKIDLKSQQYNIFEELIMGVTNYVTFQDVDYSFVIHFPNYFISDPRIMDLPDILEFNYMVFKSLIETKVSGEGFYLPREVIVYDNRDFTITNNARYSFHFQASSKDKEPGIPFGSFFIYNIYKEPVDETKLNMRIGKTFYEYYQRYIYGLEPGPDWFSNAAGMWIDELFYDPFETLGDYVQEALIGNELNCFNGWGIRNSDIMVPLVEYLVEEYDKGIINDYHNNIKDNKTLYEALNQAFPDPVTIWVPRFFQNYLEG
jgi:hypothetical protein